MLNKDKEAPQANIIFREVKHVLANLGIPSSYVGVKQTAYAVELAIENPDNLNLVTKCLYPDVAKFYHTTPCNIERNIRTIVQILWRNDSDSLGRIAGYELKQRPTSSQFIAIMADYMQRQLP